MLRSSKPPLLVLSLALGASLWPTPPLAAQEAPGLADIWTQALGDEAVVVVQGTTPRATVSLAGRGGCQPNGS